MNKSIETIITKFKTKKTEFAIDQAIIENIDNKEDENAEAKYQVIKGAIENIREYLRLYDGLANGLFKIESKEFQSEDGEIMIKVSAPQIEYSITKIPPLIHLVVEGSLEMNSYSEIDDVEEAYHMMEKTKKFNEQILQFINETKEITQKENIKPHLHQKTPAAIMKEKGLENLTFEEYNNNFNQYNNENYNQILEESLKKRLTREENTTTTEEKTINNNDLKNYLQEKFEYTINQARKITKEYGNVKFAKDIAMKNIATINAFYVVDVKALKAAEELCASVFAPAGIYYDELSKEFEEKVNKNNIENWEELEKHIKNADQEEKRLYWRTDKLPTNIVAEIVSYELKTNLDK